MFSKRSSEWSVKSRSSLSWIDIPQDRRGRARKSFVYREIRQSIDGSESPRKPVVTPEFEDERHGRPDDPLGTMCLSLLWQVGVRSVPSPGRGASTGKMVRRAEERGCSEKEGRDEWHESRRRKRERRTMPSADRSKLRRPKPRALTEAKRADRSKLRRPKPIGRQKSFAPKSLRRTERSQSRRTKPAALRARPRSSQPGGAAIPRGPRAGPASSATTKTIQRDEETSLTSRPSPWLR